MEKCTQQYINMYVLKILLYILRHINENNQALFFFLIGSLNVTLGE